MNPLLAHALCQTLLHHGSGEDAVTQLNVNRQEFKDAYYAIDKKLPGLTLDFDKLSGSDPVESDPLIAQGNLAILRLDDLYRETFHAWRSYSQGQELSASKRTIKPGSTAARTDSTHQTEIATKQLPPDATLINQAVNILLTSFKIQATITQRRDHLTSGGRKSPESSQPLPPKSQPAASATATKDNDLIEPLKGLGAIQKIAALKPLDTITPIENDQQPDTPSATDEIAASASDPIPPAPIRKEEAADPENAGYIELPPYDAISYQPPDVQEFLRALKEQPQFANTS